MKGAASSFSGSTNEFSSGEALSATLSCFRVSLETSSTSGGGSSVAGAPDVVVAVEEDDGDEDDDEDAVEEEAEDAVEEEADEVEEELASEDPPDEGAPELVLTGESSLVTAAGAAVASDVSVLRRSGSATKGLIRFPPPNGRIVAVAAKVLSGWETTSTELMVTLAAGSEPGRSTRTAVTAPASAPNARTAAPTRRHHAGFFFRSGARTSGWSEGVGALLTTAPT